MQENILHNDQNQCSFKFCSVQYYIVFSCLVVGRLTVFQDYITKKRSLKTIMFQDSFCLIQSFFYSALANRLLAVGKVAVELCIGAAVASISVFTGSCIAHVAVVIISVARIN